VIVGSGRDRVRGELCPCNNVKKRKDGFNMLVVQAHELFVQRCGDKYTKAQRR